MDTASVVVSVFSTARFLATIGITDGSLGLRFRMDFFAGGGGLGTVGSGWGTVAAGLTGAYLLAFKAATF